MAGIRPWLQGFCLLVLLQSIAGTGFPSWSVTSRISRIAMATSSPAARSMLVMAPRAMSTPPPGHGVARSNVFLSWCRARHAMTMAGRNPTSTGQNPAASCLCRSSTSLVAPSRFAAVALPLGGVWRAPMVAMGLGVSENTIFHARKVFVLLSGGEFVPAWCWDPSLPGLPPIGSRGSDVGVSWKKYLRGWGAVQIAA